MIIKAAILLFCSLTISICAAQKLIGPNDILHSVVVGLEFSPAPTLNSGVKVEFGNSASLATILPGRTFKSGIRGAHALAQAPVEAKAI